MGEFPRTAEPLAVSEWPVRGMRSGEDTMSTIQVIIELDATYIRCRMVATVAGKKPITRSTRLVNFRNTENGPDLAIEVWAALRREADFWRAQAPLWD